MIVEAIVHVSGDDDDGIVGGVVVVMKVIFNIDVELEYTISK